MVATLQDNDTLLIKHAKDTGSGASVSLVMPSKFRCIREGDTSGEGGGRFEEPEEKLGARSPTGLASSSSADVCNALYGEALAVRGLLLSLSILFKQLQREAHTNKTSCHS